MPVITRAQVRQFRAMLRRSLPQATTRHTSARVRVYTTTNELTLSTVHEGIGIRVRWPGSQELADFGFSAQMLAEWEGRDDSPVVLESGAANTGQARWSDCGVPRVVDFERCSSLELTGWPDPPQTTASFDHRLLAGLALAAEVTARDATRYALDRIQLRGRAGEIVATDSKQLFVQRGFRFPWTEDVLVPRFTAWDSRALPTDVPVLVGKTENALCLTVEPWSFALRIDEEGRFPDYQTIVPKTANATAVQLSAADADFLVQTIPRLPIPEDDAAVVTLDLGETVSVRSAAGGRIVEAVAATSTMTGKPVIVPCDRRHLLRALELGFRTIVVAKSSIPLVCRDQRRLYLWMPLDQQYIVAATPEAVRFIANDLGLPNHQSVVKRHSSLPPQPALLPGATEFPTTLPTTEPTMAANTANSVPSANGTHAAPDPLTEAEEVRGLLRDADTRLTRIVAHLKHQRRHARALRSAVDSIRALPDLVIPAEK